MSKSPGSWCRTLIIDLRRIPVYVISGGAWREQHIRRQLESVGIRPTMVRAIRVAPGIVGCALSHLKVHHLTPAPPYLVLEDDCSVSDAFEPVLDIPSEAAVVYLGISTWGRVAGQAHGVNYAATVTTFNDQWRRIHNMLSSHAILYVKDWYVPLVEKIVLECVLADVPFDMGLAELQ